MAGCNLKYDSESGGCSHPTCTNNRCARCNFTLVPNKFDICDNCQPANCTQCQQQVSRAFRDDVRGKLVCFTCLTNYSPATKTSKKRVTRVCEIHGCGSAFQPLFENDRRCSKHAARCVNCTKKTDKGFCRDCTEALQKGVCTLCGEDVVEREIDHQGRCASCSDEPIPNYNIGSFDDMVCPYCYDNSIDSDEFACADCLSIIQ